MRDPFGYAIVAGVDGSEQATGVVDYAAAEATLRGLPLVLVSAHPIHGESATHTSLTALLRRVCTVWPTLPATAHNVTGELADHLIDSSRSASLMVVGRDRSGAVASVVAAHTHCPTVVLPPEPQAAATDPVLLGLGLSADDEPAIAFGFAEAARRQVPLLAVHVWSGIPATAVGAISPFAYNLHQAQTAADGMLARALTGWADKYPEVPVQRMALYDVNPAQTLLDASELAGLVVVGAHRRSLGGSHLIGGVTRTLIVRSTRPVVVIGAGQHLW